MRVSKHSQIRSQQRVVTSSDVEIIMEFGTRRRMPGGAVEYRLPKRVKQRLIEKCKREIKAIEKASSKGVLVDNGFNEIITVYHLH